MDRMTKRQTQLKILLFLNFVGGRLKSTCIKVLDIVTDFSSSLKCFQIVSCDAKKWEVLLSLRLNAFAVKFWRRSTVLIPCHFGVWSLTWFGIKSSYWLYCIFLSYISLFLGINSNFKTTNWWRIKLYTSMKFDMLIMCYKKLEFWEKCHWKYFYTLHFVFNPNLNTTFVEKLMNNFSLMALYMGLFKFWDFSTETRIQRNKNCNVVSILIWIRPVFEINLNHGTIISH